MTTDPVDGMPAPRPPDGLRLVCSPCRHPFPVRVTVGEIARHFTERDDHPDHMLLDLAPLCRCGAAMMYVYRDASLIRFQCKPCDRSRTMPVAILGPVHGAGVLP